MSFLTFRKLGSADSNQVDEGGAHRTLGFTVHPRVVNKCANQDCSSGWLHPFRRRLRPLFEDGWTCSRECMEVCVRRAVRRELAERVPTRQAHQHRVPLGLLMLEKGWIKADQLRRAVAVQKSRGEGRIGEWLVELGVTDEAAVTRALSLQWSCPVLPIQSPYESGRAARVMPKLFVDLFENVPVPISERVVYLGFEERPDPVLALAVERMTGLQVRVGIVQSTEFQSAHRRILAEKFPPVQLVEASCDSAAAHALARAIERVQPAASRLIRVRDLLWLRMFSSGTGISLDENASISDVLCTSGPC